MKLLGVFFILLLSLSLTVSTVSALEDTIDAKSTREVDVIIHTNTQSVPQARGLLQARSVIASEPAEPISMRVTKNALNELYEQYPNAVIEEVIALQTHFRTTLTSSVPTIGANYSWNVLNYTGRNITVSVIDSGINYLHESLGGCFNSSCKVYDGYDYINTDNDPFDDDSVDHGTHVAGTIAANGTIVGVAPDARLFAMKACNSVGSCSGSAIASSLSFSTSNNADVASISIGGSVVNTSQYSVGNTALNGVVQTAISTGMPVVISAGNDGDGVGTINTPADTDDAIVVGNLFDQGTVDRSDDTLASSSSRGPAGFGRIKPDLSAPGTNIQSTGSGNATRTLSGTSMSTPHISGAIALLFESNDTYTPAQVRAKLISATRNVGTYDVFEVGAGQLSVIDLLDYPVYAFVYADNPFGTYDTRDKLESVFLPAQTYSVNITLFNEMNESITFTPLLPNLTSPYGAEEIENTTFSFPSNIVVNETSELNITINITIPANQTPSQYGGLINFSGNNTASIRVPVAISVPITYSGNTTFTMNTAGSDDGDTYVYSYYNPNSGNETFSITWSDGAEDFDLWVHQESGSNLGQSASLSNPESITTTNTGDIKWVRVLAYTMTGSSEVNLTITDNDNLAPSVSFFGFENDTILKRQNVTLVLNYSNDDSTTIVLNDSRFVLATNSSTSQTYNFSSNESHVGTISLSITLTDLYGSTTTNITNLTVLNETLYIENSIPSGNQSVRKNNTIDFSVNATDFIGLPINFSWYINNTLNQTDVNVTSSTFTFNSSLYNSSNYTILVNITTNESFKTREWNLEVLPFNAAPVFNGTISVSAWNEGSNSNTINLSAFFSDEDDNLTFTLLYAPSITMSVSNNIARFNPPSTSYFGSETAAILATDNITNVTSNNFTLTVNEVADEEEESSSSSSGGGGGGGGSTTTQRSSYTSFVTEAQDSIKVESSVETISIDEIDIEIEGTLEDVQITVREHTTQSEPTSVSSFSNTRYKTLTITKTNIDNDDITSADIDFKVNRTWLREQDVSAQDIRLYRYNNEEWQELPTVATTRSIDFQFFTATTPGFSDFIIGVTQTSTQKEESEVELRTTEEESSNDVVEEVTTQEPIPESLTGAATQNDPIEEPEETVEVTQDQTQNILITIFIIAVIGAVIGLVIFKFSKKKK